MSAEGLTQNKATLGEEAKEYRANCHLGARSGDRGLYAQVDVVGDELDIRFLERVLEGDKTRRTTHTRA